MPSFNQGRFIRDSIDSVLNQDFPNKELIVIDGGSTDNTVEILKSYGDRIAYWISETDEGQSDALNKGLKIATGDLIGWMNADDFYLEGAFERIATAAAKAPEKFFFHGDNVIVNSSGAVISSQVTFPYSLHQLIFDGFHLYTQAFFWRRSALEEKFQFCVDLHRTMDFHFFAYLGMQYSAAKFEVIPGNLGAFRRHSEQKTTEQGQERVSEEHQKIREMLGFRKRNKLHLLVLRYIYRFRRAIWYAKRKGILFAFKVGKVGVSKRRATHHG